MTEEKRAPTWLEELFPNAAAQRSQLAEKGKVFSQKYLVFSGPTSDVRARELFEHWKRAVRRAKVPKDATAQEYAAHNALREFIEAIDAQIEFANSVAGDPNVDWLNI